MKRRAIWTPGRRVLRLVLLGAASLLLLAGLGLMIRFTLQRPRFGPIDGIDLLVIWPILWLLVMLGWCISGLRQTIWPDSLPVGEIIRRFWYVLRGRPVPGLPGPVLPPPSPPPPLSLPTLPDAAEAQVAAMLAPTEVVRFALAGAYGAAIAGTSRGLIIVPPGRTGAARPIRLAYAEVQRVELRRERGRVRFVVHARAHPGGRLAVTLDRDDMIAAASHVVRDVRRDLTSPAPGSGA